METEWFLKLAGRCAAEEEGHGGCRAAEEWTDRRGNEGLEERKAGGRRGRGCSCVWKVFPVGWERLQGGGPFGVRVLPQ